MKRYLRFVLFMLVIPVYSQTITLDATFGDSGYSQGITIPSFDSTTDSILLPDGQFITCHMSSSFLYLKKINQNGIVDTTFSNLFSLGSNSSIICRKLVLYYNKILLAGMSKSSFNASFDLLLIRYNLDGTLDTTFGTNGYRNISYGSSNDDPRELLFDAAGNIFVFARHANDNYVTKTNPNGVLDTSFGTNGFLYTNAYNPDNVNFAMGTLFNKMVLQTDGKFLFAGAKRNAVTLNFESYLERRNHDGSFDSTFGENGRLTMANTEFCVIKSIEYNYNTNSILLLHEYDNNNSPLARVMLSKIQITDGALVPSFGTNGLTAQYSFPEVRGSILKDMVTLSDSKILIAGNVSNFLVTPQINDKRFIMRFNANGSVDFTSSSSGYHIFNAAPSSSFTAFIVNRILNLNNGSFLVAYSGTGSSLGNRTYLAKFTGATATLNSDAPTLKDDFITVHPNPTSNVLHITTTDNKVVNKIAISNINGQTLNESATINDQIDVSTLPNGVYIITVSIENENYPIKFVKK